MDASHSVRKLTGQDNVFNIRLIGELKIRNINQRTRNVHIKVIIEFCISGFENAIFIHIE